MIRVLWNLFKKKTMTLEVIKRTSISWLGPLDNRLYFSRLLYHRDNKNNIVIWNATVCIYYNGVITKIWTGDLDMTKQSDSLQRLSKKIKHELHILHEDDVYLGS